MAAAIKEKFGLTTTLEEGHGGIFEVTVMGLLVYSNQQAGGRFLENDAIFQEIRKYKTTLRETEVREQSLPPETAAPSCKWPP